MTSSETGSVWVRGKLVLSRIAGLQCMCLFQLAESFIEGIIVAKRKHNKYARILYDLSYMAKLRAIVMASETSTPTMNVHEIALYDSRHS